MNCNIKYITDKFNTGDTEYLGKQKSEWDTIHRYSIKKLLNVTSIAKSTFDKKGNIYVYPSKIKEFEDFVKFNKDLKDIVFFIPEGKVYKIGINVFGKTDYDQDEVDVNEELRNSYFRQLNNYFDISELADYHDLISRYDNVVSDKFKNWTNKILGAIGLYRNSVQEFITFEGRIQDKTLNAIQKQLQSDEVQDKIQGTIQYITEAAQQINRTNQLLFDKDLGIKKRFILLDERIANLDKIEPSKKTQEEILIKEEQQAIQTLLNQSKHLYNTFTYLEDLYTDLVNTEGLETELFADNYNLQKIALILDEIYDKFDVSIKEKVDKNVFINSIINTYKEHNLKLSEYLDTLNLEISDKQALNLEIQSTFSKYSNGENTIFKQLLNILDNSRILKKDIEQLYQESVTYTIHDKYQSFLNDFKDVEDKAKYSKERDEFLKIVKLAFKDNSYTAHFLSATVDLRDPLVKTLVTYIKDELQSVRSNTLEDRYELEAVLKKLNWHNLTKEQKEEINKLLTTESYVPVKDYKGNFEYVDISDLDNIEDTLIEIQNGTILKIGTNGKTKYIDKQSFFNSDYYLVVHPEVNIIQEVDTFKLLKENTVFFNQLPVIINEIHNKIRFDYFKAYIYLNKNKDKNQISVLKQEIIDFENITETEYNNLSTVALFDILFKMINNNLLQVESQYGIKDIQDIFFKYSFNGFEEVLELKDDISEKILPTKNNSKVDYTFVTEKIKNTLIANYIKERQIIKSEEKQIEILKKAGLFENNQFVDLEIQNLTNAQKKWFKKLFRKKELKSDWYLKFGLENISGINYEITNTDTIERKDVIMETISLTGEKSRRVVSIINNIGYAVSSKKYYKTNSIIIDKNTGIDITEDIYNTLLEKEEAVYASIFVFNPKEDLVDSTEKYKITSNGFNQIERNNWIKINQNQNLKNLQKVLYKQKKEADFEFGTKKSLGLPKMYKIENKHWTQKGFLFITDKEGRKQLLDDWFDNAKEGDVEILKNKQGEFIDFNNQVVVEPVYVSKDKIGTDGLKVYGNNANTYSIYIPIQDRELDVSTIISTYKTSANYHNFQVNITPLVQNVKTIINGDVNLSINKRQTVQRDIFGNPLVNKQSKEVLQTEATRLNESLNAFLDDVVYGESVKEQIVSIGDFKVNMHEITDKILAVSSFQSLAFNVSTMIPNHINSLINNWSEASLGRYFDKKDFRDAYKEGVGSIGSYVKDFMSTYLEDKNWFIQFATEIDAITGEFTDSKGIAHTEKLAMKVFTGISMFNQNAVEITNQMHTMLSLMRGFKVKDENGNEISLYESRDKNWQRGQKHKFKSYVTEADKKRFASLVQKVNREIHGNYNTIDKNMLSRLWYGRLMLSYKKWLYPSFTKRFKEEDISLESRDVEEGYYRTYFKMLLTDQYNTLKELGLRGSFTKKGAVTVGKAAFKVLGKSMGGFLDGATFNLLSKNFPKFNEYMYGNNTISDRQKQAINRTLTEMGLFVHLGIFYIMMHLLSESIDDDDEVTKKMVKFLEYNAFKAQSELGLYMPNFYAAGLIGSPLIGGYTLDTFIRLAKDPFTMNRLLDTNFSIITDIFDFWDNGELSWAVLETYDKNGKGYDKGDYKFLHKMSKATTPFIYQWYRFMNPQDQLQFMDLMYQNAK